MHLLLMRHGEAELHSVTDETRNLTASGVTQSRQAGVWLNEQFSCVDVALVSPYVRAQQTLEALSTQVSVEQVITCPDIVPSGSPTIVHDYVDALLMENPTVKTVLLVCHMPIVSFLADNFCQIELSALFLTSAIMNIDYQVEKNCGVKSQGYLTL